MGDKRSKLCAYVLSVNAYLPHAIAVSDDGDRTILMLTILMERIPGPRLFGKRELSAERGLSAGQCGQRWQLGCDGKVANGKYQKAKSMDSTSERSHLQAFQVSWYRLSRLEFSSSHAYRYQV